MMNTEFHRSLDNRTPGYWNKSFYHPTTVRGNDRTLRSDEIKVGSDDRTMRNDEIKVRSDDKIVVWSGVEYEFMMREWWRVMTE